MTAAPEKSQGAIFRLLLSGERIMSTFHRSFFSLAWLSLASALFTGTAYANQLVYVPLAQPCRLLDTRSSTPLTAASGPHLFGTSKADIIAQHGNSEGCAIADGVAAVSVNMNLLNATASGNIATWSADVGTTAPNIGTAVYNPTVASPAAGQVQYNTGYTSIPLGTEGGANSGRFYLQVANGQVDMTINVVGYWLPISWGENRSGSGAIALGANASATGGSSIAIGSSTVASAGLSTAMGTFVQATGYGATAIGNQTYATGDYSAAFGTNTTASGIHSTALGHDLVADGYQSLAIGSNVGSGGHYGSFISGDYSPRFLLTNTADNQFMAVADGGFVLASDKSGRVGVRLDHGTSSWTVLSDRNAKTAVQPVNGREVLKKITALPLNTWQYKTQDAKYRHMGPMAQDFYAAFQLGESDKGIDTVDADGVALAAIQGLNAELIEKNNEIVTLRAEKDHDVATLREEIAAQAKRKDAQIAALHAELSTHEAETAAQKKRVAALESLAADMSDLKAQLAALRQSSPKAVTVALAQP